MALTSSTVKRPAAFLDRDGVLNRDVGFLHEIARFEWVPGAVEAVKLLNHLGYLVLVVTNQSGIARGLFKPEDVHTLHAWMNGELRKHGAHIDDFAYCPHHPEGTVAAYTVTCACRKPAAGMITDLSQRWPVERSGSFMIGDKGIDLQAAQSAGIPGHLFHGDDLLRFVRNIIG